MTIRIQRSERSRHLVLRVFAGERLPEALVARLTEEGVAGGWLRASGVLTEVELRAFDAQIGALGSPRRIVGPVHVLSLEGGIGLTDGALALSLRALLAREGEAGLQTLAGEITSARTVALEVFVTVLDDGPVARATDEATGLWLLDPGDTTATGGLAVTRPSSAPAWSAALEASVHAVQTVPARLTDRAITAASRAHTVQAPLSGPTGYSPSGPMGAPTHVTTMPIPQRPTRPNPGVEGPTPEAGDIVDHFAFGRCDVVKSDGERLHLRIHKDNRVREIALEMLRVTRLEDLSGHRYFKLERRI